MDGSSAAARVGGGQNPLAKGFYTVAEAARLIAGGSARRIRGWLDGYENRDAGAILERDYAPLGGRQELSFLDLIETRLVEHFREHRVRPKALRIASAKLRTELRTAHPFATSLVYVVADRADVFVQTMRDAAVSAEDVVLRSLTTGNFVLRGIVERGLVPGLYFGDTALASRWEPRPQAFPGIFIDPLVAYGQPALESGLPTAAIRAQWEAEGGDYDAAAYWLEVKTSDVRRAVKFENLLDRQSRERVAA